VIALRIRIEKGPDPLQKFSFSLFLQWI